MTYKYIAENSMDSRDFIQLSYKKTTFAIVTATLFLSVAVTMAVFN